MADPVISTPRRPLPTVLGAPPAPHTPVASITWPRAGDRVRFASLVVALLAVAKLGAHLATNVLTPYAAHRDELLYMAMGRHLRVWQMDFPPLIALLGELARGTFGDSLVALRLAPALAGTALVVLAALLARAMGGNRTAQGLAALAVLANPVFLRSASLFQPVVLDQLWWTLALYALARIARERLRTPETLRHQVWADARAHRTPPHAHGEQRRWSRRGTPLAALLDRPAGRWWVLLGAAGGLGLLTKFSIAFMGAGVLVALLVTPLRRSLLGPGPWIALAVALVIGAPSLVGQAALDWPVLWQMRDLRAEQLDRIGPLAFLGGQLAMGPAVLLALLGVHHLLVDRDGRHFRAVGWACTATFLLLLVLRGKAYYVAPIYPALFAAGAVAVERLTHAMRTRRRRLLRGTTAAALVAYGVATLPLGLPLLAPARMARYTAALGAGSANESNTGERLAIPQDYADMLGWPQQVVAVARAYDALPPEVRADAVLLAGNYGQAGAIDFYGPRLGLPPAVSAAGSYWFFGPGRRVGSVAIAVGIPPETLRRYFRRVRPLPPITHDASAWVVPEERQVPLLLCEEPIQTLHDVWPSLRPR